MKSTFEDGFGRTITADLLQSFPLLLAGKGRRVQDLKIYGPHDAGIISPAHKGTADGAPALPCANRRHRGGCAGQGDRPSLAARLDADAADGPGWKTAAGSGVPPPRGSSGANRPGGLRQMRSLWQRNRSGAARVSAGRRQLRFLPG